VFKTPGLTSVGPSLPKEESNGTARRSFISIAIALLASGCQASRFGDKRAEFKWLELTIGIRN